MKFVTLNSGVKMPLLGFGTSRIKSYELVRSTVDVALTFGYRLFDTAELYNNEQDLGDCLKELLPKYNLKRSDLFLTSKLAPKDHGFDEAYAACQESLLRLQTDYLDLYLIHWPAKADIKYEDPRHAGFRKESWKALEQLQQEGKVRNIGVSNYTVKHLEELSAYANVQPSVLQVEYHPLLVQTDLLQWCQAHGVHLQTYGSLGKGKLVTEPAVVSIAERVGKTPAQILLQWAIQQELGAIPKSVKYNHISENIAILEDGDNWLKPDDLASLSGLHNGTRFRWDPSQVL